ncbi:MAG: hypothetical protein AUK47_28185 [Deltaproteobacteria bacterium CG2_30_63_29]|nr:MAG: hypothetical protein AUK47_28185 [Deltaproteobacteria bacterium CG2_30_63_29]PJB41686.1 MAG: hypothetical protein CO108_12715 [Deltaproteobacteria bacterium CG_4_9_14_3_um_filter_63_12]
MELTEQKLREIKERLARAAYPGDPFFDVREVLLLLLAEIERLRPKRKRRLATSQRATPRGDG